MAHFSREWSEDLLLPDGSYVSSVHDIERYLRRNNLAMASDYSDDFRKSVRYQQEKKLRDENFAAFLQQYKRLIWNE